MSFRKVYPITVFSESKSVLTKYFLDRVLRGHHSFLFSFFFFFLTKKNGKSVKKKDFATLLKSLSIK